MFIFKRKTRRDRDAKKKEEKDRCVSCGRETEYGKEVHINLRKYYIEGAGQLCEKCYRRIYERRSR